MIRSYIVLLIFYFPGVLSSQPFPPLLPYRPPAVPLFVHTPFQSFYSTGDSLSQVDTQLWSGALSRFSGLISVDSHVFTWLGLATPDAPPFKQVGHSLVSATRTLSTFLMGGVNFTATFMSPLIPDPGTNYSLLSTPASYLEVSLSATDGQAHNVSVFFSADATILTNQSSTSTPVAWSREDGVVGNNLVALRFGAASQWPLNPVTCGQSVPLTASQTIVWGHAYLVSDLEPTLSSTIGRTEDAKGSFMAGAPLPPDDPTPQRTVGDGFPGASLAWTSLAITPGLSSPLTRRATFFMDEILAASYYAGVPGWEGNTAAGVFAPIWREGFPFNDTIGVPVNAIVNAHANAVEIDAQCSTFDATLYSELAGVGGEELATYGSLIFRQVIGAFTQVWHGARQEVWSFFKEIASGGDFSTMDVIYPGSPLLVYLSPALLRAALLPLMVISANATIYKKAYVMHDLGKFPLADRPWGGQEDMPLEETGNLMHMLAAIAYREGGVVDWLTPFFESPGGMHRWRDYLYSQLPMVETQGTTDDFLGVVQNSTNLGIKGAVGLAAYGYLAFQMGNESEAEEAWEYAACSAAVNVRHGFFVDTLAPGGVNSSHFCWGWNYCSEGGGGGSPPASTFLMYNMGYAKLLRMDTLFPSQPELLLQQAEYYEQAGIEGKYGVALMNGSTGVMPEWNAFWGVSLYNSSVFPPTPHPQSLRIHQKLLKAANDTSYRAPMTDFWSSDTAFYGGKYRGRPTQGGVFAPLALKTLAALPRMKHEDAMGAAFLRGHQRAELGDDCKAR